MLSGKVRGGVTNSHTALKLKSARRMSRLLAEREHTIVSRQRKTHERNCSIAIVSVVSASRNGVVLRDSRVHGHVSAPTARILHRFLEPRRACPQTGSSTSCDVVFLLVRNAGKVLWNVFVTHRSNTTVQTVGRSTCALHTAGELRLTVPGGAMLSSNTHSLNPQSHLHDEIASWTGVSQFRWR